MNDPNYPGGYGAPMPSEQPMGAEPVGPPPPPVTMAVRLMFITAALGVVSLIVLFLTKSSLKTAIRNSNPSYDPNKLDTAVNAAVTISIVIGIIFIVLYVLLALQLPKAKNWARIVTWVITALGVLSALASLAQAGSLANRIVNIIAGLLDLAIIILLAQRPSNDFFRRRRAI
ncbi:MAG: hypothetical protein ACR2KG_12345 [Nocardioidaceae bacterium]